jgi:hypothetical protein
MEGRNINGPSSLCPSGYFFASHLFALALLAACRGFVGSVRWQKNGRQKYQRPQLSLPPAIFASHLFALKSTASRQGFTEPIRWQKNGRQKYQRPQLSLPPAIFASHLVALALLAACRGFVGGESSCRAGHHFGNANAALQPRRLASQPSNSPAVAHLNCRQRGKAHTPELLPQNSCINSHQFGFHIIVSLIPLATPTQLESQGTQGPVTNLGDSENPLTAEKVHGVCLILA